MKIEELPYKVGDIVKFREGGSPVITKRYSPLTVKRIRYSKSCYSGIAVYLNLPNKSADTQHWDSGWFRKAYADNFEEIWPPEVNNVK